VRGGSARGSGGRAVRCPGLLPPKEEQDTVSPPSYLVERFYHEVWNLADETAAREILDPDFHFRGSLGPETRGPDGFIAYVRLIHAALSGFTCTIEDIIEDGTRAAAKMRFAGRHSGTFFGVAPTGREIVWSGAAFFTTDAGRITALWVLGDVDAVKRQLGPRNNISHAP